ncbi:EAL domain-containing protein [Rhodovulum marinum]|uniref:Diguanylate cyclase (GGDEF)-like protein n=1 Tax=Rhodovulum marinum TaxID=320662 RepID=A0A4R2PTQ1_9RHOB|nr:EAL domain-containing protein [Rhodovulum marinum]TCP39227.1 diguanylate cyclase (GGDEF)-like protein [Rhodovulum marinum]
MDRGIRQFDSLIGALSGPAWLMTSDGDLVAANPAFRAELAVPAGRAFCSLVSPRDRDALAEASRPLFDGTASTARLTLALRPGVGPDRRLDCLLSALHLDGKFAGVLGQGRPVPQADDPPRAHPLPPPDLQGPGFDPDRCGLLPGGLSQALKQVRDKRDEARARAEILHIATTMGRVVPWYRVPDTGVSWFGDNITALLGLPPEVKMTSSEFRELIHPADLPAVAEAHAAIERGETDHYGLAFRVRRADGSWCAVTSKGQKVERTGSGLPYMICGSFAETSERIQIEERLASALAEAEAARLNAQMREEMLKITSLRGGIGHFSVNPGRDQGWATDATYRLLGYEPGAFPSTDTGWRGLIHPDDLPGAVEAMEALQQRRTALYEHEHRLRHGDGTYHWYRAVASWMESSDPSQPPLLAGAVISTDQNKENEAKLAQAATVARRARERLNTLADNAPGAIFEYREDKNGSIDLPYFSARLSDILGVPREEMEADGATAARNIHPEDAPMLFERIRHSRDTLTPLSVRYRLAHPEKGLCWLMLSSIPSAQTDGAVIWYGTVIDITEQCKIEKRAEEAAAEVRRAHERLSSVAEIAPVGLYEFHWYGPMNVRFTYTSAHFDELIGCPQGAMQELQAEMAKRIHPEDFDRYTSGVDESSRKLTPRNNRFRFLHPERGTLWLNATATPREGADGAVIWTGALRDVTADAEREAELRRAHRLAEEMRAENEHQALHDALTGLPNRRCYDRMLGRRREAARTGGPTVCTLIRVDIDHFKYVNDTLGHEAGDQVLKHLADVLRESLRAGDVAARIGGDEFSVLLAPGLGRNAAEELVERIRTRLAKPMLYNGRQCRFGVSFGIAEIGDITELGEELQLFADAALYRAKAGGRNRIEFFTPELHHGILEDRRIAAELQEALERDQFVPFFQPQVSAADGSLVGVETLLRWNHPEKGLLAPDAFMRVAEQLRIVPEIDRLMMEKSRTALARWRSRGVRVPKISFNVSSGRMHDPDVVSLAREMVAEQTNVTFELLESILVEEESDAFRFHLDMIREAGIDIEIDDFGSGHASIIGLMEIAPSALKIDRRIVAPVAHDDRSCNLLLAIVEIAETLCISTIAEGVETEEQADIIRKSGCDTMQGYLFARPLSEEDFLRYVLATDRRCA